MLRGCCRGLVALVAVHALSGVGTASGARGQERLEDFRVDIWGARDGLATDAVRAVVASPDGGLWVGTDEGLYRFDGTRFSPVEITGAGQPRWSTPIVALHGATDGTLSIGTSNREMQRGRTSGASWTNVPHPPAPGMQNVRVFTSAADGTLWMGGGQGVAVLRGMHAQGWQRPGQFPGAEVRALAVDAEGRPWVGTDEGLWRFDGAAWQAADGGASGRLTVRTLHFDSDGVLWVGTAAHGLLRLDRGHWRALGRDEGLPAGPIAAVHRARDGRLWVATRPGGLAWLDGERLRTLTDTRGLCLDRIIAISDDDQGSLWLGTEGCALVRLGSRPFSLHGAADGLSGELLSALDEGTGGAVWVGLRQRGVSRFLGDGAAAVAVPTSPGCAGVLSVWAGRSDQVWITCADGHTARLVGERFVPFRRAGADTRGWVLSAAPDDAWFIHERVVHVRGDEVRSYDVPGLGTPESHYMGPTGRLWVGGQGAVARFDSGQFLLHRFAATSVTARVLALHEDGAGTLWIATSELGLWRFRDGRFVGLDVSHGLPSPRVFAVLEDDRARLWMSGRRGIFWADKTEVDATADGRRARFGTTVYGPADGISMSAYGYGQPPAFKARDGRLWFATSKGAAVFAPDQASVATPPTISLTLATIDGRRYEAPRDRIQAGVGNGHLEIEVAALFLARPEAVRFRHKLEGLDADWQETGPRGRASYPRVPHGRYRFIAAATTGHDRWSDRPVMLDIVLVPPFHATRWFFVSCGAALLLAAVAVHRLRLHQAQVNARAVLSERTRIAREMHDTLAQSFVGANVQLECAERALEQGRDGVLAFVRRAREVVDRGLGEARRSVWALRPEALDEVELIPALRSAAAELSGGAVIEVSAVGRPRPLGSELQTHLLRVAREAMTNAVRHGHARAVGVVVTFDDRGLRLVISDDGQGFPGTASQDARGSGLRGMRERAQAVGGALQIDSGPDGTRVTLEVPG